MSAGSASWPCFVSVEERTTTDGPEHGIAELERDLGFIKSGQYMSKCDGLGVGQEGGDGEVAGALDVREEGAKSRHKLISKYILADNDMA